MLIPKQQKSLIGFFYDFSNYGVHASLRGYRRDRLSNDGLTQWHPAFLSLGRSLDECAAKYRNFCRKYKPKPKPESTNHWGSKLLPKVLKKKKDLKKRSPGQLRLPWDTWEATNTEIRQVAEKFVIANCYDPKIAAQFFNDS